MNFTNPLISFYTEDKKLNESLRYPFLTEISWIFLMHLNNRLGMFKHRLNIYLTYESPSKRTLKLGSIFEYKATIKDNIDALDINSRKKVLEIIYEAFIGLAKEFGWDEHFITCLLYTSRCV